MEPDKTHPLRIYRKNAGLTLDGAAALFRVSKSKLCRIETGWQDADLEFVRKVVKRTGGKVTAEDFVRFRPLQAEAAE